MSKANLIIPALGGIYERLTPFALPLLRVVTGLTFAAHGYPKIINGFGPDGLSGLVSALENAGFVPGIVWVWLAALTEFVGGIAIALGLFTRAFAFSAAVMMYLITFVYKGPDALAAFYQHKGGIEYDFVLAVIFTMFVILGAGGYSIDAKLKKTF
ncbi:MAG TPA: DoxX family protein [Sphingomonadales bacterium]|nr:DoxX family protein [Sphingomonadales bacterium]